MLRRASLLQALAAEAVDDVSAFRRARVQVVHRVDDIERREYLRSPGYGVVVVWIAPEAMDRDQGCLQEEVSIDKK